MKCRICEAETSEVLDLGCQPLVNALKVSKKDPEKHYPLILECCGHCGHMQVGCDVPPSEIFNDDYPYFSSINKSYVDQCSELAKRLIQEYDPQSVFEIGCNDGYMLENFKHLEHLGIDPSFSTVQTARNKGLKVLCGFFPDMTDPSYRFYDLILANNVIAHVPDPNDFVQGVRRCLDGEGLFVIECPDSSNIDKQWDTIYHEHYSYFSMNSMSHLLSRNGMRVEKFEQVGSHGGSLRVFARHRV